MSINWNMLYAMLPVLFLFFLVYSIFSVRSGRISFLTILCFLFGILTVWPAAVFEEFTIKDNIPLDVYGTMFSNYLIVGFIEEFVKLLIVYYAVKNLTPKEASPSVYVILAFAGAMGFAFMENIIYVYDSGLETAVLRAFSSIPMHGATAIVIGLFGWFEKEKQVKYGWLIGFVFAMFMHGLYNTYAIEINESFWFYGIFVISGLYSILSLYILILCKKIASKKVYY